MAKINIFGFLGGPFMYGVFVVSLAMVPHVFLLLVLSIVARLAHWPSWGVRLKNSRENLISSSLMVRKRPSPWFGARRHSICRTPWVSTFQRSAKFPYRWGGRSEPRLKLTGGESVLPNCRGSLVPSS